jgi:hypothetical protein
MCNFILSYILGQYKNFLLLKNNSMVMQIYNFKLFKHGEKRCLG